MFKTYSENLKYIGWNLVLLYRNFIHWNISKLLIFLYANIAWFILSIPFIAIMVFQYFHTYSALMTGVDAYSFLDKNIGAIIITMILFVIIVANFIATYTYGYFLLLNVYKSYTEGEKLSYGSNLYFSWKHFWTYLAIVWWVGLYLLLPIIVLLVIIVPFGIAIKMDLLGSITSYANSNIVIGGISLLIFIAVLVWFIHLTIRLTFSYFLFLYSGKINRARTYIKSSLTTTKGKVWKIIFLALPFLLVIITISSITEYGQRSLMIQRAYRSLTAEQAKDRKTDQVLLEKYFDGDDAKKQEFATIEKQYTPSENSINRDLLASTIDYLDIKKLDPSWWIFTTVLMVISYLLFEGVTSMVYLSIYLILTRKKEEKISGFRLGISES